MTRNRVTRNRMTRNRVAMTLRTRAAIKQQRMTGLQ